MRFFPKPLAILGFFVLSLALVSIAYSQVAARASQQSAQSCDRTCLISTMDSYLAALVAHDPSRAVIAKDVPDPVSEQVGFVGVITHSGPFLLFSASSEMKPGIAFLALRLKVQGREITESG